MVPKSQRRESEAECLARLAKQRLGCSDLGDLRNNDALLSRAVLLQAKSFCGTVPTDWKLQEEAVKVLRTRLNKVCRLCA